MTNYCETKTTIPIFSMRLAGLAMANGFVLLDMKRNRENSDSKKNVFYFKNSPELLNFIDQHKGR